MLLSGIHTEKAAVYSQARLNSLMSALDILLRANDALGAILLFSFSLRKRLGKYFGAWSRVVK